MLEMATDNDDDWMLEDGYKGLQKGAPMTK